MSTRLTDASVAVHGPCCTIARTWSNLWRLTIRRAVSCVSLHVHFSLQTNAAAREGSPKLLFGGARLWRAVDV
eukprot:735975-Prymnesium_polylepis.2